MTSQEKQLTKNWKTEVTYQRTKRNEEISHLKYQLQLKNESLLNKEKSIMALIDRNVELQNTIRELQNTIGEQSKHNKKLITRLIVLKNMIENNDKLTKNNFDITKVFRIFTK